MTEEKRNALKQAAEVIAKWYHNFRHSLQQLGHWLLDTWRKHVRRKERRRMLEEIKKQPAEVIPRHPNCRHQVTHKGPMPGHDMENSYRIGESPYKGILEQSASVDQVGQAMHAAANAAADGFKEGARNPGTLADLLKQREERREAEKVLHFGNGVDVTLGTLSKYTHLSVSTLADMDGMELAFLYASVKEQMDKNQAAEGETTEVAQQVGASLQRIYDAGYDPQAAEEAKERAREVERELLEAKRDELQQALRYTKKSVRKKNIERQIAEVDQRLAEIPAGVKK